MAAPARDKLCWFQEKEGQAVCVKCGYRTRLTDDLTKIYRQCQPATKGLGDFTENVLASIGITKDRYKAAKELFGLSPTCNCELRKQWLNRVSDWWRGQS